MTDPLAAALALADPEDVPALTPLLGRSTGAPSTGSTGAEGAPPTPAPRATPAPPRSVGEEPWDVERIAWELGRSKAHVIRAIRDCRLEAWKGKGGKYWARPFDVRAFRDRDREPPPPVRSTAPARSTGWPSPDDIVSTYVIAEFLRICVATVRGHCRSGLYGEKVGNRWRIRFGEVLELLREDLEDWR